MARNRQGRGALYSKVFRMPRISDLTIWLGWRGGVSVEWQCFHVLSHTPQHTWNFWHHTAQATATTALQIHKEPSASY